MSVRVEKQQSVGVTDSIIRGVMAGLVAGAVFGLMMATMEMLPMVGSMIGAPNAVVGFGVHLVISAVIGATYGAFADRLPVNWLLLIGVGLAYGILWWVLGALLIMPLTLGMTEMVFVIGDMQLMSLIGHISFGIILAAVYQLSR